MNTQQLECFIQVAENLNFARAAKELHITQPAVSRQINALEAELGAKLFNRTTRTVSLTPIGSRFLADAGDILNKMKYAAARARNDCGESVHTLSIGGYDAVDLTALPIIFRKMGEIVPDIRPSVHIVPHKYILDWLLEGNLDIMLGFEEGMPMCSCVVTQDHPFAGKKEIGEKELLGESMVICDSPAIPPAISQVQNRLKPFLSPPSVCYCDQVQAAISLIKSGFGFAVLPELKDNSDTSLVSVPVAGTGLSSYGLLYRLSDKNTVLQRVLGAL